MKKLVAALSCLLPAFMLANASTTTASPNQAAKKDVSISAPQAAPAKIDAFQMIKLSSPDELVATMTCVCVIKTGPHSCIAVCQDTNAVSSAPVEAKLEQNQIITATALWKRQS